MNEKDNSSLLDDILNEYDNRKTVQEPAGEAVSPSMEEDLFGEEPVTGEIPLIPDETPAGSKQENVPEEIYDEMGLFREDAKDIIMSGGDEEEEEEVKEYISSTFHRDEPADEEDTADGDGFDDEDDDDYDEEYDDDYEDDEEDRPGSRKNGVGKLIVALVMVTLVISVSIIGAAVVISASGEILGLERSSEPVVLEIPENTNTDGIAKMLADHGIIKDPRLFRIFSKIRGTDGTYTSGEHTLIPNMTYNDVIEELQKRIVVVERETVTLTFEEGITLDDAARRLEENGVCPAADFIEEINTIYFGFDFESHVETAPLKYYKMEGYFFPDTYEFYLEEEPRNVVKTVFRNFDNKITPDMYGRMDDLGLTLDETITLASIVQKEARNTSDMKAVASVFLNRLDDPYTFPKLQSDPTTNYSLDVVTPGLEVYSQSICDAYDTYKGDGLPPGAICNPGLEAIEAVLYPMDSNYYYFCSNVKTGRFYFAETLSEHEKNLEAAGIK